MAHAARVLSEDSPAAPAVRLAVEQGRVTVSDASRVIYEPTEVQLRALERVTGGGSRNPSPARRRGCPPGVDCGGGRGYRRCWADPMAGLANACQSNGRFGALRRWGRPSGLRKAPTLLRELNWVRLPTGDLRSEAAISSQPSTLLSTRPPAGWSNG